MNDSERHLIRFVCDGDMRNAQKAVKTILNSISSKKMSSSKSGGMMRVELITLHIGCRCLNRL